jgi:hypothetical protein
MTTGTKIEKTDRSITKALPGGLYCVLGDNVYDDNGALKYEGKAGIKYGRDTRDWVRMSYSDFVIMITWALEHKDFINTMVVLERKRAIAPELK